MKTHRYVPRIFGRALGRALLACAFAGALAYQAPGALNHRYSFSTDASDSIGGAHGTLMGNASIAGGQAIFPGTNRADYIMLPPGMISNFTTVTFEFWTTVLTNGQWEEIYAFGDQNAANAGSHMLMFTPHSGANDWRMSYAQADPGYNDEYVVIGGVGPLDNKGPICITCVYDPPNNAMTLYTNGARAGVLSPVTTGATAFSLANIWNTHSQLGRSLYSTDTGGDAPFSGLIDEFRIFDTPLTALQVAVDYAAGPGNYVADPGLMGAAHVSATNMIFGVTQPATLLVDFANVPNVPLTMYSSNWVSSNPSAITVDTIGNLTAVGAGSSLISATYAGVTGSATVAVTAVVTNLVMTAPSEVVVSSARQLTAIARFSDGSSLDVTTNAAITYTSSVPTVASVPNPGRLAAWTNGTATITATFSGFQDSKTVTVVSLAMTHRWSFNDSPYNPDFTPNTNALDSIGSATGALMNAQVYYNGDGATVGFAGAGGGVNRTVSGYIEFPPNLFTNYGAVTFETWVTEGGSTANWGRIYDFGNNDGGPGTNGNGTRYMFLSLPAGSSVNLRGAYTVTGGGAGEQVVEWANGGRPPVGQKAHVVWTTSGASKRGRLYVDGILRGTNANMTMTPEDVGPTANDWLGRSQFNDVYFMGSMDEFRVYNGELDPLSIALDTATGPDAITNNPGALQALLLTLASPMNEGDNQQLVVTGNFANVLSVPMTTLPQVTYLSGNTKVATVTPLGMVTATGPGTTIITVSAFAVTNTVSLTVIATPTVLTHRWSFNGDYNDSVGGAAYAATPQGAVFLTNNTAAYFDGVTGDYVALPNDMFTNYNSITIETWYTDGGSGTWARYWDLGNNNSHYMFLAPAMRAAYNTGGGEQTVNIGRPANNVQHHVVFTQDALSHTARLYLDGVMVGQNNGFTFRPKDVGTCAQEWLGRSQYPADPYFIGTIDEFRTYTGAISPQQAAYNYAAGPDTALALNPAIASVQVTATNMTAGYLQQALALATITGVPTPATVTRFATNWTTSDATVLKVDKNGVITAVGAGTATVSATYAGQTGSASVTVSAGTVPGLIHRYSFTSDASDSIGGANGTLNGGAVLSGGKVVLYGTNSSYVVLPGHLLDGLTEVSLETWATFDPGTASNARLWDFGDYATNNYLAFSPRSGGPDTVLYWNFGTGQATRTMTGTAPSYNTNTVHYVWVVSPVMRTAQLYINGVWKETFTFTAPLSAISNAYAFLGHAVVTNSPPGDLNGSIDEFRIWNGALDQLQIASSYAAGPDNPLVSPGAPTSLGIVLNDPTMVLGTIQRARVTGNFATVANLNLTAYPGQVFTSDQPTIVKVTGDDRLQAVGTGTANITVSYGGKSASAPVTVVAQSQLMLTHRYNFVKDASDAIGKADGTMYGNAKIVSASVVLDGTRNPQTYVQLPRDLISGYDKLTIEAWTAVGATGGAWERLWDFGNHNNAGGLDYIYQSPYSGAGGNPTRLGLRGDSLLLGEVDADSAGLRGAYVQIVSVVDQVAGTMTVYTNGLLAASYAGATSPVVLTNVNDIYTFIGRSQFNDNWYNGSIDDFRVYYGAMTAVQAAASYAAGATPEKLTIVPNTGGTLTISWPQSVVTAGYALKYSDALGAGAVWNAMPGSPNLSNGVYSYTITPGGQASFFALTK